MEKYYMFLMTNNSRAFGEDGGACVLEAGLAVQGGFPWASGETSVKVAQVCLCSDPDNVHVHQGPDVKWVDVTEGSAAFSEYLQHSCPDQLVDQDRTAGLAENLHALASELPDNGSVLDVIWPLDVVKHLALSDHTALFGALKRLVEWHGAFVHILLPSGTPNLTDAASVPLGVQPWADLLHASLLTTQQLQDDLAACQWRGHINITGSKDTKSLRLPHFCMAAHRDSHLPKPRATLRIKTTDTDHTDALPAEGGHVTGGYLEFVTAVKRSQIPSFYLTNHAYSLSVPSCSAHLTPSRTFLHKLANDTTAAYILRVRHGQRWRPAPPAGGGGRGRTQPKQKEWKDLVMDNIANVTDDRCVAEVAGDVTGRQFLVWYQPHSPGGSKGVYVAFLLRRPDDISGHMTMMLAKQELRLASCEPAVTSCDPAVTLKVADLLSRLPHYGGEDLLQQEVDVETAQLTALKAWLDERRCETVDGELSVREVVTLLRAVRQVGWDTLQEAGVYSSVRPDTKRRLAAVKPEYEADVLSQWEGVSLRLREAAAGVRLLKRHSDDSLGGLAPPTGQVVTLDANEFLKHFNDDGTAQKTDRSVLRPLRSPSRRFCKYNSGDITRSEWPACLRARDHGIYYNCEERAALERQCERMRGRLQAGETASTCTLQQTHNPATITLTDTPAPMPGANVRDTCSTSRADTHDTDQAAAPNKDGPTNKRKSSPDQLVSHSKRLLGERKRRQAEKVQTASQQKEDTTGRTKPNHPATSNTSGPATAATKTESRSQRHKRKLQDIVELSLTKRGVTKDDAIFTSCVSKLFMLTKCFVKDLKTSHNLRQEMERIAESNVDQVIEFARRNTS